MSTIESPVEGVSALLQGNAGPMTLEGTQSFIVAADQGAVVIDPGDLDESHQRALASAGPIGLILVTHRHHDHVGGLELLRELTGAPSRGVSEDFSVGAPPLRDNELIVLGGGRTLRVMFTPGHTSDSVSFVLQLDGVPLAVFTGDTILGHGTTIIDHPDGDLGDYLASLERLGALGAVPTLPAHGGFPGPVHDAARAYLAHRTERLEQVRRAAARLASEGVAPSVGAVTDIVYADVPPGVRPAAEHTVAAQLALLARRGELPPAE